MYRHTAKIPHEDQASAMPPKNQREISEKLAKNTNSKERIASNINMMHTEKKSCAMK
jgi:hypothetical protein